MFAKLTAFLSLDFLTIREIHQLAFKTALSVEKTEHRNTKPNIGTQNRTKKDEKTEHCTPRQSQGLFKFYDYLYAIIVP